nr:hypothetical protein CFP56_39442 [Quercus suber]
MDEEVDSDVEVKSIRKRLAAVKFSKEFKQQIRTPWSKALIVTVYGRMVGFNFIHNRIGHKKDFCPDTVLPSSASREDGKVVVVVRATTHAISMLLSRQEIWRDPVATCMRVCMTRSRKVGRGLGTNLTRTDPWSPLAGRARVSKEITSNSPQTPLSQAQKGNRVLLRPCVQPTRDGKPYKGGDEDPKSRTVAEFQLSSLPWPDVGFKFGGSRSGNSRGGINREVSKPNTSDGVVQQEISESMEDCVSYDKGECEGG